MRSLRRRGRRRSCSTGRRTGRPRRAVMPDGQVAAVRRAGPEHGLRHQASRALGKDAERHAPCSGRRSPSSARRSRRTAAGSRTSRTRRDAPRSASVPRPGAYEQWQVSNGGGSQPRWRADGRELYYATPDGDLMAVAIATEPVFRPGTPRKLFRAARAARPGHARLRGRDARRQALPAERARGLALERRLPRHPELAGAAPAAGGLSSARTTLTASGWVPRRPPPVGGLQRRTSRDPCPCSTAPPRSSTLHDARSGTWMAPGG